MRTDKIRKYLIPNIPYLFILWAFLKLGTAYRLAAGNDFAHKLIGLGQTIGPAFADFAPGLAPLDWLVGIVGAVGFRLLIYFKSKNAKKFRRDAEYGSARWGTEKDIKPFVDPRFENNVILTGTEFLTMNTRPKIPANARNLNCCIIGSSGSGKTRFWLTPQLLQAHSSYVVVDPKGGVLGQVGAFLQKRGYKIKVFNSIDFSKSMHYNPLAYIRNEADILKFVDALISNTKGEGKEGDPFWTKSETLLYCALIAYIIFEGPAEDRNMNTLVDMISGMEVKEDDEDFMNAVDYMFAGLEKRKPDCFAVKQYKKYKLASGKTAKSILISCGARLAPFDIPQLREVMAYDELELDRIGDRKTAVFFIISDTTQTYNFLVALAFSQMFNLLCERADNVHGGRLPHHVPVLGVCLGHQLLGLHAGAQVDVGPCIMHGKQSEIVHDGSGLFEGLPNPMKVARYHSLVVHAGEGEGNALFTVTARAPEGEVMALQYRDRPWVGVQFHPESILTPDGLRLLGNFPQAILPRQGRDGGMAEVLEHLARREDLTADMASRSFGGLMDGRLTPAQAGSFLMGLRMKGESSLELAYATRAALARAVRVEGISGPYIDVVGTGGDGRHSFNCSTATSLVLAGMGYKVVKHGNRAVSSTCGSADALESLGIPLDTDPAAVADMVAKRNFAFLFAPHFHPAFKNIGPLRKELGVRTLFNLLGPMINPARPSHLLMGVARPELVPLLADTLSQSALYRAAVVCGAGNYDELTPMGPATAMLLHNGSVRPLELDPADFGFQSCTPEDLAVESREEAVAVLRRLLDGEGPRPMRDMVALNVGLAIFLMEEGMPLDVCMARAREAVRAGLGRRVLHAA